MNDIHTTMLRTRLYLISLLMLIPLLAACASTSPAPTASIDSAKSAISNAEQAGARLHAGAELQEARSQLRMAEQAATDSSMVAADQYAQQSKIAAELAMAKTRTAKALDTNRDIESETNALRTETQRRGDQ